MSKLFSCFAFSLLLCLSSCLGYSASKLDQVDASYIFDVVRVTPIIGQDFTTVSFPASRNLSYAVISEKDLALIYAGPCQVVEVHRRICSWNQLFEPSDTIINVTPVTEGTHPNGR